MKLCSLPSFSGPPMHLYSFARLLLVFALVPGILPAQSVTLPDVSPAAYVRQTIGITEVSVDYHRPAVRGREIWGSLVPYGFTDPGFGTADAAPWRAGANLNTIFRTSTELFVAGAALPAGTYGLHMAIEESGEVTVIFSANSTSWGSYFYDSAEDALRVTVAWEDASFREGLTYEFTAVTVDSATLSLLWEKKRIPIPLTVETPSLVMQSLKDELRGPKGFVTASWVDAALYAAQHNIELEVALGWIDHALSGPFVGQKSFRSYEIKAQILEQMDRPAEARETMQQAIRIGSAGDLYNYGRQLLAQGDREHAREVFELNAERHPESEPARAGLRLIEEASES